MVPFNGQKQLIIEHNSFRLSSNSRDKILITHIFMGVLADFRHEYVSKEKIRHEYVRKFAKAPVKIIQSNHELGNVYEHLLNWTIYSKMCEIQQK